VSWIRTIPFSQAGELVQQTLRDERARYPKEDARDPSDEHEMIATRASALDAALAKALVEDYEHAPLSASDRTMLDYASQPTTDATRITPEHHAGLRAAGFDDRGILQTTLIAAWFNDINRVADALGVAEG
jgi:alkylhydroperoxidase family enzyme